MPRPTGANSSWEQSTGADMGSVNQEGTKRLQRGRFGHVTDVQGRNVRHMSSSTLADFLLPTGFERPPVAAVLREGSSVAEIGRYALRAAGQRRIRRSTPYAARTASRLGDPVILVPGFLAGDGSLSLLARTLRAEGFR